MLESLSTLWLVAIFAAAAIIIAIAGTELTRVADRLGDVSGWGDALVGAVLLGGVTSLSGITTSVTAAYGGHPELAFSNAVGGIAAQTVFLAVADLFYRRANLEHDAASVPSLLQGVTLIGLLGCILIAMTGPEITLWQIHPVTPLLVIVYIGVNKAIKDAGDHPRWQPVSRTGRLEDPGERDRDDEYGEKDNASVSGLLWVFAGLDLVVGLAGFGIAQSAIPLAERFGLSQSFVGALGTAVATSLPELIVAVTAVRRGALTLAVANIIGGNTFDLLFLCFSDVAFRGGSLYHVGTDRQLFIIGLTVVLTAIFLLGLLFRQKDGPARIGWESATMIGVFLLGQVMLYFM